MEISYVTTFSQRAAVVLIVTITMAVNATVVAGEVEEKVFRAFETYCLTHLGSARELLRLLEAVGAKPIPDDKVSMMISPQTGKGWLLPKDEGRILLTLTTSEICTVAGMDAKAKPAISVFEQNIKANRIDSESFGSEKRLFYAVTYPNFRSGGEEHAVVIVSSSNLSSVDGIVFHSIPEAAGRRKGLTLPTWP